LDATKTLVQSFAEPGRVWPAAAPPGMDGMAAAQKLWDEWGKAVMKIVAVSASVLD